jgi:chemotaxis protein MotB
MLLVLVAALLATGCTGKYKQMVSDKDAQIAALEGQLRDLEGKLQDQSERNEQLNSELAKALSDYRDKEQLLLEMRDSQQIITVPDIVLFNSGNADLTEAGTDIVDRITNVVMNYNDRLIRVEGYTDNVPIGETIKDRFPSNWELSTGRACSVLRYMYWKHKVDPMILSAVGYGEHRPVASNDTEEGRAKNRRVVIIITPKS